ncbi:MAG: methyltransferase domain-containing protein [Chthoniobacterales bacterium]|nr:methyltransferase domain-containing protein [Chthoniobacterales bacterium]
MGPGTCAVPSLNDPGELFGRVAPLVLDLGCGNGVFLAALAAREAESNCLGIEKKAYRVAQTARRVRELCNARVLHGEVTELLRSFPAGCAARVYLLFSDPWPKRRHSVRRLVQEDFASVLERVVEQGGEFFFASDAEEYCASARRTFASRGEWSTGSWETPEDWPRTEFEERFRQAGLPLWRFKAVRGGNT